MPTLDWIGKDKVINHHLDVPYRVLEKKYTFGADNESENKIIKGDNLEALKSLLPEYEGRIDCIYIDPPYNTGNEKWVYNDNVNDPKLKKWLGQVVGQEGEDLSRHDKWLCMMYPRLRLLHKLLAETGLIFISIDDSEYANLKLICNEIFGANNFLSNYIKQSKVGGGSDSKFIVKEHEYCLVYAKDINHCEEMFINHDENYLKRYKEIDENGRFFWDTFARPGLIKKNEESLIYDIECPDGALIKNRWIRSKERFEEEYKSGIIRIIKKSDNGWSVQFKQYLNESGRKPRSMTMDFGGTIEGKNEIRSIFNNDRIFDYPKSSKYIKTLISTLNNKNSIILDSFAGSGTTAHAVLNLNKEDGGNRKFILIEMMDYAETITAERVKRVINGYSDVEGTGGDFSFYEIGEPLLINNEYLNEKLDKSLIRQYIFFMETKQKIEKNETSDNEYYLGYKNDVGYYFYYEKDKITNLDYKFLSSVKQKYSNYIIYADKCTLSKDELIKHNITFKKIPRDITRL